MKQMSIMNQYDIDTDRFVDLFSKFTGVGKPKLFNYLETNSVTQLFEHPTSLNIPASQVAKVDQLKEMRNLYSNLKSFDKSYVINSETAAGEYFREYFAGVKDKERFCCAFLDNNNRIITTQTMTTGTVAQSAVYPREIAKSALLYDASSVILSHNHPAGTLKASPDDLVVTQRVGDALATLNINVLDHIIVGNDSYLSFASRGLPLVSDRDSISEVSSVFRERIINQYSKEFPGVCHITEKVASCINDLNIENGKPLTIKEIKKAYTAAGKNLEADPSDVNVATFDKFKDVVDGVKQAQSLERKDKAQEKALLNPSKSKAMEMAQ